MEFVIWTLLLELTLAHVCPHSQDIIALSVCVEFFFYKYLCWLLKYVLFKAVCALNCKNGGTCQLNNGVSQCICSKFYLGTLCEICNCLKIWVDNN